MCSCILPNKIVIGGQLQKVIGRTLGLIGEASDGEPALGAFGDGLVDIDPCAVRGDPHVLRGSALGLVGEAANGKSALSPLNNRRILHEYPNTSLVYGEYDLTRFVPYHEDWIIIGSGG